MTSRALRWFAAGCAFLSLAGGAAAQTEGRPVRVVLGFPAGGGSDTVLRVIAQRLSQQLGQPVR